jgi:hypothetical protein
MRFEVPAGSALVFSGTDGELLAEPVTRPLHRVVEASARHGRSVPGAED